MKTKMVSQAGVRAEEESDTHGIAKLTVAALKKELGERGLRKNGNKAELRARLEEYLDKETVGREATTDAAAAPFQSECV